MPRIFKIQLVDWLLFFVIGLASCAYWAGVPAVPFHPDESTCIYMSADWELLFSRPAEMAWQPDRADLRQTYRLLDAPLSRYLCGAARQIAGRAPLAADWDWSRTWEENQIAGALPDKGLLNASRMGAAALFPFSLALIYLTGWRLGGRVTGWTSLAGLAGSALVLIHTRRAMAEGGLIFCTCLWMAALLFCRQRPWLIALPAALAFCAKQSTLPLAAVGALAVLIYSLHGPRPAKPGTAWLKNLLGYGLLYVGVIFLLNPFLWARPLEAAQAAVAARQELLARQTYEYGLVAPDAVLNSPDLASVAIIANLWFTPPAIADIGNYLNQTQAAAQGYLAVPFHHLLRDLWGGALLLLLSLVGLGVALKRSLQPGELQRSEWALLALAGLLQFVLLALSVTLPFQRYVLPLVPFSCLWAGAGFAWGLKRLRPRLAK